MMRWGRCFGRFLAAIIIFTLAGPAVSQTGGQVSYTYDERGRLTSATYTNGAAVQYSYDAAGNRTGVTILPGIIGDSVPTLAAGPNLIDLSSWPVGEAPAGAATVSGWIAATSYSNEARWAQVTGPGQIGTITAMEAGQTETDPNGGGAAFVNWFDIDPTKAYEYTIYFRKHDLSLQNIYFGPHRSSASYLSLATGTGAPTTNPYSMAWGLSTQATYLDANKWYKVVGYVLPEGHPLVAAADWGGIYDVETGARLANTNVYRWNPDRPDDRGQARFFTYYSEGTQNTYTTYFYRPEARVTSVSYTPVVPTISTSHADAAEGGNITFTVNLSQATTVPIRVDYIVDHDGAGDSAEAGDYTAIPLTTLTIPEGENSATITVSTINNDSTYEGDEAVRLTLSNPDKATITSGQEVEKAFILDGVGGCGASDLPCFSIDNVPVSEGTALTFTVSMSNPSTFSHNVTYATSNGTATGPDYTAISATVLTFSPGQTTKPVSVSTTQETIYENNETVNVNLSGATSGATISDSQGIGTINNDDDPPSFTINDPGNSEGYSMSVVVTKSGLTAFSHNVSYATANGTAIAGSDYTAQSGTFTFTSLETIKSFSVSTIEDAVYENDETFNVNLSGATNGATIADSQGVGAINNDDPAPSFYVSDVTGTEGGTFTFTISKLDYYTDVSHSVNYATASGSATSGSDFTGKSGSLTFTSAQVEKTVSVTTIDDSTFEGDESFTLNLSAAGAANGAGITDGVGIGLIHDNDTANQLPVAVNDSGSMVRFSTKTFYVLGNDSDPDGDPLTITSAPIPSGLSGSIGCSNTCITVTGIQTGTRSITYAISDGNGGTDTALLTVTVTSSGGGGPPL